MLPRGLAAAAGNRGRRWAHRQGLAPAKGAGGRFIRREDIGKPFASGLKALDAQGRAQALARCDEAEPSARAAQAAAELRRLQDRVHRNLDLVNRALSKLIAFRQERQRLRAAAAKQRTAFGRDDERARAARAFTPADQDMIEEGYLVGVQMARVAFAAAQKERSDFLATLPEPAAD